MESLLGIVFALVPLALIVVVIAGAWKMYAKAGKPGWSAIVPIYNLVVLLNIVGRPVWYLLLFIIPVVNLVVAAIVSIDLAKSFGKGTGYGIGILLLGFIFIPMLGFGSARYKGPAAAQLAGAPAAA